ncbi:hypothetical protein ACIPEN_00470 [Herbaspirillum chlorophenolicum]|uniref:Uncharacterized protein n=1 Tax=Herbaspirillum chlorophenolicum TaxID=211589 RepID=A0ABW8ES58_9BURK
MMGEKEESYQKIIRTRSLTSANIGNRVPATPESSDRSGCPRPRTSENMLQMLWTGYRRAVHDQQAQQDLQGNENLANDASIFASPWHFATMKSL